MQSLTPAEIAADLRRQILDGEIKPGEVLPKGDELAETLGVGQSTVRTAYKLLREENLVEPRRNRGTVVLDPVGKHRLSRAAMERDERGYYLQSGSLRHHLLKHDGVRLEEATPAIAHLLDIKPGSEVVVRSRVLGQPRNLAEGRSHDQPLVISTSYLPAWVADAVPAVKKSDSGKGGIYDRLEETLGGPLEWLMVISAELATAEVSKQLSTARTSAILRQQRITKIPDGRPVELLDQRVSGDRFEISYTIPRAESAQWAGSPKSVSSDQQKLS